MLLTKPVIISISNYALLSPLDMSAMVLIHGFVEWVDPN
jgi:hypothetical protein